MTRDEIQAFLVDHAEQSSCHPVPLDARLWATLPADQLHHPFGWMPPARDAPGYFVFRFCPDIIAEQTAHLTPEQVHEYLETIGFCADMHVTHWELPVDQRERMIDRTLYDIGPRGMQLLNDVQMRAIDAAHRADE